MFCKFCGANVEDDATFCGSCGKPMTRKSAPAQKPMPAPAQPLKLPRRHSPVLVILIILTALMTTFLLFVAPYAFLIDTEPEQVETEEAVEEVEEEFEEEFEEALEEEVEEEAEEEAEESAKKSSEAEKEKEQEEKKEKEEIEEKKEPEELTNEEIAALCAKHCGAQYAQIISENDDGTIVVQVYDEVDGHTTTFDYYTVNTKTLEAETEFGFQFNLNDDR